VTQPFYAAYINLDRAPARRAFMDAQLAAAGITAARIPAIDRAAADFQPRGGLTVSRDDVLIETNWDGRAYVTGEEACLQSHLAALAAFLASGAAFGVIFEDDAELAPEFRAVVEAAIARASLWDAVKLEGLRRKGGRPALTMSPLTGSYRLVASLSPCAGAAAYLFSRAAAARVIAAADGTYEPYDNLLSALWRHRLRILDCAPFPARQGIADSTRADIRAKPRRSAVQAFTRWRRHMGADLVGRHIRRWTGQIGRFGANPARFGIAAWARHWPAPPAQIPPGPDLTSALVDSSPGRP
jgi:glycosyl transferase family 25